MNNLNHRSTLIIVYHYLCINSTYSQFSQLVSGCSQLRPTLLNCLNFLVANQKESLLSIRLTGIIDYMYEVKYNIRYFILSGEELSKKQATQEALIRKLRAQIREIEEEKKGLTTKLQASACLEIGKERVESIKKDKTATEKLLQETIEKHQVELAAQKDFYTNALNSAREAEVLAEARANNEARTELESRLREAEEREYMLVQTFEELRQTLSRKEQQAVFREDMFCRDIEDLQKRYQASELQCEELITQVPESTIPLLRQIEAMQETTSRKAEAWAAVERSLNSRLQFAGSRGESSSCRREEQSVNERLSQTLSRINVLEAQISCLRAEQTQLSRSLDKERQRAAENRQEYLAAKEEADTQEGRANQLEEEIRELRRKHKQELHDALVHRELLQQEVEREKAARVDLERTVRVQSTEQAPIARHNSTSENGSLSRKLTTASSIESMEEGYFLQASLDSSDAFSEKKKDCRGNRIRAELEALRRRHTAALELMGERDEELEELRADIVDLKEMYREQVNLLVNKIQRVTSSVGNS
ncbi:Golgin candidate 5 [Hibiscus syriacus]|uniref:Golgin candidate 5 n=1 Tax=Hibiscus syriacus TaxID=106335 RepID=A0A6A3ABW9_HIBSY|nr:Golgin candidate 5 [Hibiscus syriacus]